LLPTAAWVGIGVGAGVLVISVVVVVVWIVYQHRKRSHMVDHLQSVAMQARSQ
jgi:hypothetical protein